MMALRLVTAIVAFAGAFCATFATRATPQGREVAAPGTRSHPAARAQVPPDASLDPAASDPLEPLRLQARSLRKLTGALTVEERRARIEELRLRMPALIEARDGAGLVQLMRELAALGPDAYAAALQIAHLFIEPGAGVTRVFGVRLEWFREHAFSGLAAPMVTWAIEMPDLAPPWFRGFATDRLVRHRGWWPERKNWMLGRMRVEDDDAVARMFGERIGDFAAIRDIETLGDVARRADGPGGRAGATEALGRVEPPWGRGELETLAASGDLEVSAEAKRWLGAGAPAGTRILDVALNSRAEKLGLRPGDVVLKIQGESSRGKWSSDFHKFDSSKHPDEVEVIRGGSRLKIRIPKELWRDEAPWGISGRPFFEEAPK
ncbi:MAG: PDZ domain-containing protein [Planctomycetota bacterium]